MSEPGDLNFVFFCLSGLRIDKAGSADQKQTEADYFCSHWPRRCRRIFSPHSSNASQRQSFTRLSNVSISLSLFILSRSSEIFRWESCCQRFGGRVPGGNPKKSSRISSSVNPVSLARCTTARR